jgi:hypothetical protein
MLFPSLTMTLVGKGKRILTARKGREKKCFTKDKEGKGKG